MTFGPITPILRIFDQAKAREFYIGFLGFTVGFEYRSADDLPLYMEVSRAGCTLHLSEHHGDCSPGAHLRLATSDVSALHAEFAAKHYNFNRPGIVHTPWGTHDLTVTDPFGNRITFFQPKP